MKRLVVILACMYAGGFLAAFALEIVACSVLHIWGNLCGLAAIFYGAPVGAVIGGIADGL